VPPSLSRVNNAERRGEKKGKKGKKGRKKE
jgi:hypothetical protein